MLDDLLKRQDVTLFINEIRTNERYFKKDNGAFDNYPMFISQEIALYIFYDALLKYKIILDDIYLFDEYLIQLEKLYKKIDNFPDITKGINKLICRMVIIRLGIKNIDALARKEVISFIYNKYITDGYFIHGFNTSYLEKIKNDGFRPEDYENYYEDFQKMNNIFAKYNVINIVSKDFSKKTVFFTDDMVMACYYSNYAPMFFYKFLANEEYFGKRIRKDAFLKDDFNLCIKNLKRFMSDSFFSESDKKIINELVKKQWDLLHRNDKKISLLFVKRRLIYKDDFTSLEEFFEDNSELDEVIDRLLSSKYTNVSCEKLLDSSEIELVNLDDYYNNSNINNAINILEDDSKKVEEVVNTDFLNAYGKASIFIILGSLFISLGVIITIIIVLKGM